MDNNDNNYYQDQQQQPNNQQQQPYYQPQQQQPYYQPAPAPYGTENEPPMTLGDWIITLLLLYIPCVNIIMIFVWAFGSDTNTSKKNFARAVLIFALIGIALSIILSSLLVAFLRSMLDSFF